MNSEDLRRLYRDFARHAAQNWQWGYDLTPEEKKLLDRFIKEGPVLDAGCGVGRSFSYFERRGLDIVGIDSVPEMLERAQEQIPLAELVEGELSSINSHFQPDTFAAVVCLGNTVAGLIEEWERRDFFKGVAGVMKPSGVFCIDCAFGSKEAALTAGGEIVLDRSETGGGIGVIFYEVVGGVEKRGYQYYMSEKEFTELLAESEFSFQLFPTRMDVYEMTMAVCHLK